MDFEIGQLDLRYEGLRRRSPPKERRLLASLADVGQQIPIVVVAGEEGAAGPVVIDGYKRIRALRHLACDLVAATTWDLGQLEALLLERRMRTAETESALEQGWLLLELQVRFAMTLEDLGRRFDKTPSWVSRRLALVAALPGGIQEHVRAGAIVAHAAMKYLVPLARANRAAAEQLAAAIAPHRLSSRQIGALYAGYVSGSGKTRELVLGDPMIFLRAEEQVRRGGREDDPPSHRLLGDLGLIASVARRADRLLRKGLGAPLSEDERTDLGACFRQAEADVGALLRRCRKELTDARSEHASDDSQVT